MNTASRIKDFFCCETRKQYFSGKSIGPVVSLYIFSLILGLKVFSSFNVLIPKESIWFLIVGFIHAAVRSWVADWRQERMKPLRDMLLPYFINYPITLSVIYIGEGYLLRNIPYIQYVILYISGLSIDHVWHRIYRWKINIRNILKLFNSS